VVFDADVGNTPTKVFRKVGTDLSGLFCVAELYIKRIFTPETDKLQFGIATLVLNVNVVAPVVAIAIAVAPLFTDVAISDNVTRLNPVIEPPPPVELIVTAPNVEVTVMFVPATMDVTPPPVVLIVLH
jgi:hypothetical protein